MKGFIEILYRDDNYLVNLENVAYIYPASDATTCIVFNTQKGTDATLNIIASNTYDEIKAKINASPE